MASKTFETARIPNPDQVKLYSSLLLPVLDYACITYHSMLTVDQSKEIEKLQRNSLRVIYGPNISYAGMLEMSGLEWLPDRRLQLLDNFAKEAAEDPKYREEKFARTSRLYNSPLYFMRRRLNQIYTPTT